MKDADLAAHWSLESGTAHLNHGSFGACPTVVLQAQARRRARLEADPVRFMLRELPAAQDAARAALAAFVGARADDLVFVPNATAGVNTVLRSLRLERGDELLATDHGYNACNNALDAVAERAGARVVRASLPFPLRHENEVVDAVLAEVGPRTRLALLDHVTSATGLVLPIARLVAELSARGVDTLVDGAHAPGMLALDLRALGAAYYTANCHKWLCTPKAAGFLHVREDRQDGVRPLAISHGANSPRTDRSRFQLEFEWTGTDDPTARLCVPDALAFLGGLLPGGWPELMLRNHALAVAARDTLCSALEIPPPAPDAMIGSLAAVPLPDAVMPPSDVLPRIDPLQAALRERDRIQVPVFTWPAPPRRLLRVSAQAYNAADEYERLARALVRELAAARAMPR
jgi:isopenicillin-N epimerase